MSAPTTAAEHTDTTANADPAQDRTERINALAEQIHSKKKTANEKKPHAERSKDAALWKESRREAAALVRRETVKEKTKQVSAAAATSARSEAASAYQRNRAQLAPWLLAAPYAALGESAWLVAEYSTTANPAGIGLLAGATAAGGSIAAWKRRLRRRIPGRFVDKVRAGMGTASVWAAGLPLVDGTWQAGMWAALVGGTSALAASWWREHDHPIPMADEGGQPDLAPAEPQGTTARRVRGIIHAWEGKVAPAGKAVPHSTLEHVTSTDAVDKYRITLDDGGQVTGDSLEGLKKRIGMAIGVMPQRLSFEQTDHPAQIIMRHIVKDPTFSYDGPLVLCNGVPIQSRWELTPGATVDIVVGSYLDGDGYASYRIIEKGSVNSAFLLGGMGSGKTRTAEIIAIGLRMLGCYILWIDGQSGASSPLLNKHADETFEFNMLDRDDETGVAEFTTTLATAAEKRNRDLTDKPELGGEYTYDPHRPPVVAMMDEAHELFQTAHPREKTYGRRLGAFAAQVRKCGIALVALSQDYDKTDTFGGSGRLREPLVTSGNFIAMRQTDRSRIGMLPKSCPPLDTVPDTGYGYLPLQSRPDALWRSFNLGTDPQSTARSWLASFDPPTLESDLDLSTRTAAAKSESGTASGGEQPTSGRVVHFPGTAQPSPVDPDMVALSETEQRALSIIQGEPQSPTTLGTALNVSQQGAGKTLRKLNKKGYVVRMEDGRYMAKI